MKRGPIVALRRRMIDAVEADMAAEKEVAADQEAEVASAAAAEAVVPQLPVATSSAQ